MDKCIDSVEFIYDDLDKKEKVIRIIREEYEVSEYMEMIENANKIINLTYTTITDNY